MWPGRGVERGQMAAFFVRQDGQPAGSHGKIPFQGVGQMFQGCVQIGGKPCRWNARIALRRQGVSITEIINRQDEGIVGAFLAGQYRDAGYFGRWCWAAVAVVEDGGKERQAGRDWTGALGQSQGGLLVT